MTLDCEISYNKKSLINIRVIVEKKSIACTLIVLQHR